MLNRRLCLRFIGKPFHDFGTTGAQVRMAVVGAQATVVPATWALLAPGWQDLDPIGVRGVASRVHQLDFGYDEELG
jgi:hypothetical protein